GEDVVREVYLEERLRFVSGVRDRGRERVELRLRVVGERFAGVRGADRLADGPEARDRLVNLRGVADEDRDVRAPELLDGGTLGQARATRDDEVGTERHDLLDVDTGEG